MGKNKRKSYGYQTANGTKHNLKAHLILAWKYRKKLLANKKLTYISSCK